MYAVIKTGGKQYRVQPGDLLVVEKLDGEPGAELRFDSVLMLGDEAGVTVGAPLIEGAAVSAVLIETRKGEKVKIFKKIRRQGYRRTKGHRQPESVLRVIGLEGDGKSAKWDGKVDLTTKAELNLRARNLAVRGEAVTTSKRLKASSAVVADDTRDAVVQASVVEHADPVVTDAPKKAPAKKAAAPKTEAAEAPAKKAAPKKAAKADDGEAAAPKKAPAKKAAPKADKA